MSKLVNNQYIYILFYLYYINLAARLILLTKISSYIFLFQIINNLINISIYFYNEYLLMFHINMCKSCYYNTMYNYGLVILL